MIKETAVNSHVNFPSLSMRKSVHIRLRLSETSGMCMTHNLIIIAVNLFVLFFFKFDMQFSNFIFVNHLLDPQHVDDGVFIQ